jgi:hypothetical protein
LTASDVNNLVKVFVKEDRKWKNGEVLEIDVE